jgi:uncharacterized RDD family membrane protein YckC
MSTDGPDDQAPRRMPWEPEAPPPDPTPAEPPAEGWVSPSPTDPTTVWTPPAATEPPPPATPPPWQPAPDQGTLISSAPVGWTPPPPAAAEVAPGLAFADTPARVVAYIVDLIILGVINAIIGAILYPSTATMADLNDINDLMARSEPVGTILTVLIDVVYFVTFWTGGRRATIGQRILNIQVGNAFDGRSLSLEQAIRRWLGFGSWIGLLALAPGLALGPGLILLLWSIVLLVTTATSPTKQGLHDRFANTAVVRPSGQGSGLAMACVIGLVVIVALVALSVVALIFLGGQVSTILSAVGESI